ncbi:hypothetical protein [Roseicitreum antarcticum]|uniref:Uncharacterized protein n=1 Tax=Roseicitreum antarcticum TaxID=564137 RepID=A0A1H2U4L3_9RHOB|nr:hypothetical protein [Roseicitreum antarcticum]SDW51011.1 hypothetical protein SAMN04488238_102275 [Roseicitreum antarcticum]
MQNLRQPETFEFLVRYLLSRYIFRSLWSRLAARHRPGPSEIVQEATGLGAPMLSGWIVAKATVLRKRAMPGTHPEARACDFTLQKKSDPGYIASVFQEDGMIFRYLDTNSLPVTDADRSDIHRETLYAVRNGKWRLAEPQGGTRRFHGPCGGRSNACRRVLMQRKILIEGHGPLGREVCVSGAGSRGNPPARPPSRPHQKAAAPSLNLQRNNRRHA